MMRSTNDVIRAARMLFLGLGALALVGCGEEAPLDKIVVQITIPEGHEAMVANWGSIRVSSPESGAGDCVSYVPGTPTGVALEIPPIPVGVPSRVVAEAYAAFDNAGQPVAPCQLLVSRGSTPFLTIQKGSPKTPMQVLMGPVGEFIKTSSAQTGAIAGGGSSVIAVPTQPGASRHGASMTTLPDGRVVIIGGATLKPGLVESGDVNGPIWNQLTLTGAIQEVQETVEIYDPATGIFEVLATDPLSSQTMANPRMFHNAVWLDSIQHIAIVGGWEQPRGATGALENTIQATAVIELFDPYGRQFLDVTTVGSLQVPRAMATTNILEYNSSTGVDQYLLVGGGTNTTNASQAETSFEIVNMSPNSLRVVAGPLQQSGSSLQVTPPFAGARFNHRAVIVDDCFIQDRRCVYFIGGESSQGATQGLVDVFDVASGALYPPPVGFQAPTALAQARVDHDVVYVPSPSADQPNFMYVIGGFSDTGRTSPVGTIEVISTYDGSQLAGTDFTLKTPRGGLQAVMMDGGKVLVSGGLIADGAGGLTMATTSEIIGPTFPYDPLTGNWSPSQNVLATTEVPLLTSRFGHNALFMDNDQVLVLGGLQKIGDSVLQVGPATATNTPSELYVYDPSALYEPPPSGL